MKLQTALVFCLLAVGLCAQQPGSSPCKPDTNCLQDIVDEFENDPIAFHRRIDGHLKKLSMVETERLIPKLYRGYEGFRNETAAHNGVMGFLNLHYNNKHNKIFRKKIRKKIRQQNRMVLIVGDSWFNFPLPLKSDLTKIMRRKDSLLVYACSFGGDWLSEKLKDQEFYRRLTELQPETFILSGGGNDIVGERLSEMINLPEKHLSVPFVKPDKQKEFNALVKRYEHRMNEDVISKKIDPDGQLFTSVASALKDSGYLKEGFIEDFITPNPLLKEEIGFSGQKLDYEVALGTLYLGQKFFENLVALELQYKIILKQMQEDPQLKNVKIITHGYDYPIPSNKKACFLRNPWQAIVNRILGTGKWLYMPMRIKGINSSGKQRIVAKALIFYFNKMLINMALEKNADGTFKYPNLVHVDNRTLAEALTKKKNSKNLRKYWFDELHPKRSMYNKIANVMYDVTLSKKKPATAEEKVIITVNRIK